MSENIHPRATTTPLIRKQIQKCKLSNKKASKKFNVSVSTIEKWRKRKDVHDRKSGAPSKSKHITPEQEAAIVAFRINTQSPLDDCYEAFKDQIPKLSLSAVYRLLKRHGINKLPDLEQQKKEKKKFKQYDPGYVHVDITQVYTEEGKLYLFVGIDRTTKFCFVRLYRDQKATTAVSFLQDMYKSFPNKIRTILTDNGKQFTHHGQSKKKHIFKEACEDLGIDHRLTKPYHPWTNGQVERMNRTLKEATIKKYFYKSFSLLKKHLYMFVHVYNFSKKLKSIKRMTPYEKVSLYLQSKEGKSYLNPTYKFTEAYS